MKVVTIYGAHTAPGLTLLQEVTVGVDQLSLSCTREVIGKGEDRTKGPKHYAARYGSGENYWVTIDEPEYNRLRALMEELG